MNHAYRLVFNRSLGLLQAVAETARARGKGSAGATRGTGAARSCHGSGQRHSSAASLAFGLGLALAAGPGGAQIVNWSLLGTGDWSDPTNWTPNGAPDSASIVRIYNSGTAVINNGENAQAGLLLIATESDGIGHLRIDAGGQLNIHAGLHIGNIEGIRSTIDINGGQLIQHGGPNHLLANGEITLRNNGVLNLLNNGNGGAMNMAGGTFILGEGSGTLLVNAFLGSTASQLIFANNSGTDTISTRILNSVAVTHNGTNTTVLTGDNSYILGTRLNAGVLSVSQNANLGDAAGTLTFNGGTLRNTASFTMSRATTLDAGGGTFDVEPGATLTQNGRITGTGALRKTGGGTLLLNASNNNYSGGTTVEVGRCAPAPRAPSSTTPATQSTAARWISTATLSACLRCPATAAPAR